MKLNDENEEYKKLNITKVIAEYNFEESMKRVIELKSKLEKAEKLAAEHHETMLKAQKQLDEFLNSFHSHTNFYKKNC